MRPLLLLVLAELVVLVWLTVQWLGGAPALATTDREQVPSPPSTAAAVPMSAALPAITSEPPAGAPREPVRDHAPEVAANDPVGIVVSGTVRSAADGTPVDASVSIGRERTARSANGGAPGTFAIAGLQPGEWKLYARADGFAAHEAPLVLDARAFQTVDVELQPQHVVRVKLLDGAGKPVVEQLRHATTWGVPYVVATEQPLTADLPPTAQSRLTRFGFGEWHSYDGDSRNPQPGRLAEGYAGELRMNRPPPAVATLLLRTTVLQSQRIERGLQELVFTIEPADVLARHGTVRLRLLAAATGEPLANVLVNVRTAQGGGTFAKTDATGLAVIERIAPGLGMLQGHPPGELDALYRYVKVPSGGAVDLGDVSISERVAVKGVVLGADGEPAAEVHVQWTDLDQRTFPQPLVSNRSSPTDAAGRFTLACGRHRYLVTAHGADGAFGHATVDASHGAPATTSITLARPNAVTLRATFPPTAGYTVSALASDRTPVAVATLASESRPARMSLPRGDWTIEIHDLLTDRLVRSFALAVGADPLTIDVP